MPYYSNRRAARRGARTAAILAMCLAACGDDPLADTLSPIDPVGTGPQEPGDASPQAPTPPPSDAGTDARDASNGEPLPTADAGGFEPPELPQAPEGTIPPGSENIAGMEFFQRIAGKWSGMLTSYTAVPSFPMEVDFAPSGDTMLFGKFVVLPKLLTVVWGFNIEAYDKQGPVLAYRNGGFLFGAKRDSRTKLVEHDPSRGFYRFCAVKESGVPGFGCNWIETTYTFTDDSNLVFEVSTLGERHISWSARRVQKHELPKPFPASSASQGDGSAAWPPEAEL